MTMLSIPPAFSAERFTRRARERRSLTVSMLDSSICSPHLPTSLSACMNRSHSDAASLPVRIACELIPETELMIRIASWLPDISSEKNAAQPPVAVLVGGRADPPDQIERERGSCRRSGAPPG